MAGDPGHADCELCGRTVPVGLMTLHHLTPRQEGGRHAPRTALCKPCHKQIHAVLTNRQLARQYSTIESLRSAESLQSFLAWIRRQKPDRVFRTVRSRSRPRR